MENGKQTTKTEFVRNADTRDKLIKMRGVEVFERFVSKDPDKWGKLKDIPIPKKFQWLWMQFLNIWQGCEYDFAGNIKFTFGVVNDYVQCFQVPLSVAERKLLFKMKAWACNQIAQMKEDK